MGFFRNIGNAFARFMYGRNGMDHLNMALLWLYLIFALLRTVVLMATESAALGVVWDVVLTGLMVVIFFRMFSKNVYKRRGENGKWLALWQGFKTRSTGAKARHADKDHKYFTCQGCKTICRVPVGKGKLVITCPKCGREIHGKS